ncbi:MAG: hypothetical protein AAGJ83_12580, partial [Planctomycetota bacterium]
MKLEEALDQAEKDCESTTEVAQAINQLQLGLQKAVAKKQTPSSGALDTTTQSMPNPFDSLPGVDASTLAAASSVAATLPSTPDLNSASTSGLHAAVPVRSDGNPYAKSRSNRPKPAVSRGPSIWLVVGIAALVIALMIPAVVYFSTKDAIARQQSDGVSVIADSTSDSSFASGSSAGRAANASPGKASPTASGSSNNGSAPSRSVTSGSPFPSLSERTQTRATRVASLPIKSAGVKGAKWILGAKQGNGSFEQGVDSPSQTQIPGWEMRVFGKRGGWKTNPSAQRQDRRTFAFAGPNSELALSSEKTRHRVTEGDVVCVSASIGGRGAGQSRYEFVLGFRSENGTVVRYQLPPLNDDSNWGGSKPKQAVFGYRADASVRGMNPFVEVLVSNADQKQRTAMLDQVVMTVLTSDVAASLGLTGTSERSDPSSNSANGFAFGNAAMSTAGNGRATSSERGGSARSGGSIAGSDQNPSGPAQNPSGPASSNRTPPSVREIRVSTGDEGGADATVKRGGSVTSPLGSKPNLTVQTRNNRQIQHAYLRFMVKADRSNGANFNNGGFRGGLQQGGRQNRLPVETAKLVLVATDVSGPATVRVFGAASGINDRWPEDKIVWSNSLSSQGLGSLSLLAEQTIKPGSKEVSIESRELSRFLADSNGPSVT